MRPASWWKEADETMLAASPGGFETAVSFIQFKVNMGSASSTHGSTYMLVLAAKVQDQFLRFQLQQLQSFPEMKLNYKVDQSQFLEETTSISNTEYFWPVSSKNSLLISMAYISRWSVV